MSGDNKEKKLTCPLCRKGTFKTKAELATHKKACRRGYRAHKKECY